MGHVNIFLPVPIIYIFFNVVGPDFSGAELQLAPVKAGAFDAAHMTIWEAIILGLVQGITEFLPISSTAHLIISAHLMNLHFPGLGMEILLHLASVLAVTLYFRKDLWRIALGALGFLRERSPANRSSFFICIYLGVATVVTAVLGIIATNVLGDTIRSPKLMGVGLLFTAFFLIAIERFHHYGKRGEEAMTWLDSVLVGVGQAVAVLPGISRSGSTLITALYLGLERETAVRFSFLLAIPVILGSSVLAIKDIQGGMLSDVGMLPLLVAFVITFFASLAGIFWLISFLRSGRLLYFAIYCIIVGIFCLTMLTPAD